ncbi:exodeoxyribonuclease V subunit beta [Roseateles sp.]|uniref:UvrD-helicase domain-containing protein n=1 Tax=Roseateles sp. TaxID=1971397 RepID=UPI0025DF8976|nr:UvrD-helicase domain-containing protein [Roseateles sp.]MBV8034045.1 UvrD-helicase domain-containing protein [Roseateles sp.]
MSGAELAYWADGQRIPREHFYALACDPARSIVVEACAGAGKTWMLVSRILRALLAGAEPQQIVAITFTRKAAGEMRERLAEWLAEFARAPEAEQLAALNQRGIAADEAVVLRPRLATLQAELLRGGRAVEVRTFHGWFSQLLRAAPLAFLQEQGIAPELQLVEDEEELMPTLWRRFHVAVLADEALRADFQALTQSRGRFSLREWLLGAFAKRVELRLAEAAGVLENSLPGAAQLLGTTPEQFFAHLREPLLALARQLGQAKGKKAQDAATALEQAEDFEACFAALFTQKGEPRKLGVTSPDLDELCEELQRLQAAIAQQRAADEHAAMRRLALVLVGHFEALKRERGLVDMNDLERGALALLGDAQTAGWVQQRLDAQVRHLLIDEFQDTSPLQWQALHGWLQAYAGAGAGSPLSVFIVGDPKQSIYRFRRADPRVFAAAQDFVCAGLAGVRLACDHTRRNAPEVLAAVNAAFDGAQRAGAYEGFRLHTTEVAEVDGLAGLWALDAEVTAPAVQDEIDPLRWRPSLTEARHEAEVSRRAPECERVCAAIVGLLRARPELKPGDLFVLARKRDPLRQLSAALTAAGVPHAAPEEQPLAELPDVADLLALLDALASPGHDLSLAHALRSPLFGATEADLLTLAEAAGTAEWLGRPPAERRRWWDALQGLEAPSPALARAQGLLRDWAGQARLRTPHELLDRIVDEGELLARIAAAVPAADAAVRLQSVQALLQAALELDGGRYAQLYGFVRALKSRPVKFVPAAAPDAVQLLTIHGAKGLEAEVVFLLDTDAAPPKAETLGLLLDWPVGHPAPRRAAFLASEARPPPSLQALVDEERREREREELNGLYVALTRARRALVLSHTPSRSQATSWWDRLQPLARSWPLALDGGVSTDGAAPRLQSLPRWQAPPVAPQRDASARDARQAKVGEALHRVLEWVSAPDQAQPLDVLMAASAQAFGLDARSREQLAVAAKAILASPDCRPFFDPAELLWAGNEVAVGQGGEDQRIDRLVQRRDGSWWVLDYKLGATPERETAYLAQMRGYVAAVQALQPDEPVRAALISGTGRFILVD